MSKLKTFLTLIKTPNQLVRALGRNGLLNWMSDETYLKCIFKSVFGYDLDLKNPKTFNEKLQWLKLYNREPEYTMMVDKYKVREYIRKKIGEEYLIPLLGVWDSVNEINFDSLPDQFVLKCNHDQGSVVICKDKKALDIDRAKKKLAYKMSKNHYYPTREWPYKDIPRKIICEQYMEDKHTSELRNYKFFCFNGVAKCHKADFDQFVEHRANYFTPDGELMKLGEEVCPLDFDKAIPAPANLDKMKEFAEELSATTPFLQVGFYDVDGKVYFGELTFYPASGLGEFIYKGNDELLGSWIKLPENIGGGYCLSYKDMLCVLDTAKEEVDNTGELSDYKVLCFDGEPKLIELHHGRFTGRHTQDFYDANWRKTRINQLGEKSASEVAQKPMCFDEMLRLSRTLSEGIPHVRVDWYIVDGKLYFSELTFYDASGFDPFQDKADDLMIGSWITAI